MDEADIANDYAQTELDRRIKAARGVINRSATVADSLTDCKECGATIPDMRRAAIPGCSLCVDCQGSLENGA